MIEGPAATLRRIAILSLTVFLVSTTLSAVSLAPGLPEVVGSAGATHTCPIDIQPSNTASRASASDLRVCDPCDHVDCDPGTPRVDKATIEMIDASCSGKYALHEETVKGEAVYVEILDYEVVEVGHKTYTETYVEYRYECEAEWELEVHGSGGVLRRVGWERAYEGSASSLTSPVLHRDQDRENECTYLGLDGSGCSASYSEEASANEAYKPNAENRPKKVDIESEPPWDPAEMIGYNRPQYLNDPPDTGLGVLEDEQRLDIADTTLTRNISWEEVDDVDPDSALLKRVI